MSNKEDDLDFKIRFPSDHAQGNFTIVPNYMIRENKYRLPLDEWAILTHLLSHKEGWHANTKAIMNVLGMGRDRVKAASASLTRKGFIRRIYKKTPEGTFRGCETYVFPYPPVDNFPENSSSAENRSTENQAPGSQAPLNNTKDNNITACRQPQPSVSPIYKKQQRHLHSHSLVHDETPNVRKLTSEPASADAIEIAAIGNAIESNAEPSAPAKSCCEDALAAFLKNAVEREKSNSPAGPPIGKGVVDEAISRDRIANVIKRKSAAREMSEIMDGLRARGLLPDGKDKS